MADPAIILVSEHHADTLLEEFQSRYERDYDLRTAALLRARPRPSPARSATGRPGGAVRHRVAAARRRHVLEAFHRWRAGGRRPPAGSIAAHWDHFLADAPGLRGGMAKGKYDAYLLMPRGVRDEEFHTAITELLSDWGSTVPQPEVVVAKIDLAGPRRADPGDPRLPRPDGHAEPASGTPTSPRSRTTWRGSASSSASTTCATRWSVAANRTPIQATQRARRRDRDLRPRPSDIDARRRSSTSRSSAPARPGSPPRCTRASEGLSVVVLEAEAIGGQAGTSSMIRNYLGFPRGISGMRLAQRARNQAIRFGTRFFTGWAVTALEPGTDEARTCCAPTAATCGPGRWSSPPASPTASSACPRSRSWSALGVYYGAAMTAAREMEGYDVVVVGGGNSAGQAAIHLARFARSVTIVVRRPGLEETMSTYLIDEIGYNPRITVLPCTRVVDGGGDGPAGVARASRTPPPASASATRGARAVPAARRRAALRLAAAASWPATSAASCSPGATCRATSGSTGCRRRTWPPRCPGSSPPATSAPGSMKRVAAASGEGRSVVPLVHAYLAPATEDELVPAPVS